MEKRDWVLVVLVVLAMIVGVFLIWSPASSSRTFYVQVVQSPAEPVGIVRVKDGIEQELVMTWIPHFAVSPKCDEVFTVLPENGGSTSTYAFTRVNDRVSGVYVYFRVDTVYMFPSFSPDGQSVAVVYVQMDESRGVRILGKDGSARTVYLGASREDYLTDLRWTQDGGVAFRRIANSGRGLTYYVLAREDGVRDIRPDEYDKLRSLSPRPVAENLIGVKCSV